MQVVIGLFGFPNGGKSTLLNTICQKHIAIVSDKPQTTHRSLEVQFSNEDTNVKLIDTPGMSFVKKTKDRQELNKISLETLNLVDYPFFIIPVNKLTIPEDFIKFLEKKNLPLRIIINKIDMIKKNKLPLIIQQVQDIYNPVDIICVSGKYNVFIDYLINFFFSLKNRCKSINQYDKKSELSLDRELYFTQSLGDVFCPSSTEEIILDFMRESLFQFLRKNVPYEIKSKILEINENDKSLQCTVQIILPNHHYEKIILSRDKNEIPNIKKIKQHSLLSMEKYFNKKIQLKFELLIAK